MSTNLIELQTTRAAESVNKRHGMNYVFGNEPFGRRSHGPRLAIATGGTTDLDGNVAGGNARRRGRRTVDTFRRSMVRPTDGVASRRQA